MHRPRPGRHMTLVTLTPMSPPHQMVILLEARRCLESPSVAQLVPYCDWMSALGHTDQELARGQEPGGGGKGDRKTSGDIRTGAVCGDRRLLPGHNVYTRG